MAGEGGWRGRFPLGRANFARGGSLPGGLPRPRVSGRTYPLFITYQQAFPEAFRGRGALRAGRAAMRLGARFAHERARGRARPRSARRRRGRRDPRAWASRARSTRSAGVRVRSGAGGRRGSGRARSTPGRIRRRIRRGVVRRPKPAMARGRLARRFAWTSARMRRSREVGKCGRTRRKTREVPQPGARGFFPYTRARIFAHTISHTHTHTDRYKEKKENMLLLYCI